MTKAKIVGKLGPEPTFDIMYWLKRQKLIGQLYPAMSNSKDEPIYGLMVPLTIAVDELRGNVSEYQLKSFCDKNDIFRGTWIEGKEITSANEFHKFKENVLTKRQKGKTTMSLIKELADALSVPDSKIVGDFLEGSIGSVAILDSDDQGEPIPMVYDYIAFADTKRQFSALRNAFRFMTLLSTMEYHLNEGYSGRWQMDRLPTTQEAELIRKYLGFKKRRDNTEQSAKVPVNNTVLAA